MLEGRKRIIAMWSGPRNLSTAMMRSFSSRSDCDVVDEPYYAAYLAATGLDHPMRDDILAAQSTDPEAVKRTCLKAPPPGRIVYQKHMTHHMLPRFDTGWMTDVTNVFLIRAPERVLASYAAKRETVSAEDIGFLQQHALFSQVEKASDITPLVIDAGTIRNAPAAALEKLCDAIGIPFEPAMLSWQAGRHASDGVWAEHWYNAVWQSTGFDASPERPLPALPKPLQEIADAVRPAYEALRAQAIRLDRD